MAADFKALDKNVQGALIAGGVAILFSFFSRFNSVDLGPIGSGGFSAWHGWGTFGMLLVVAAVAILALKSFSAETLPDGVPWNLAAFAAAALGTVILILRGFTYDFANPGWSGYIVFVATAALTFFAFTLFKASGDKIPEIKKDTPPAA